MRDESIHDEYRRLTNADRSKKRGVVEERPLEERDISLNKVPAVHSRLRLGPVLALRFNRPCIDSLRVYSPEDHPLPGGGHPPAKSRRLE